MSEGKKQIKPGWRIDTGLDTIRAQLKDTLAEIGETVQHRTPEETLIDIAQCNLAPYTKLSFKRGDDGQIQEVSANIDYVSLQEDIYQSDVLKVDDLSQVPDTYTGYVFETNDHGNCSLYHCDKGELTDVWAVV